MDKIIWLLSVCYETIQGESNEVDFDFIINQK